MRVCWDTSVLWQSIIFISSKVFSPKIGIFSQRWRIKEKNDKSWKILTIFTSGTFHVRMLQTEAEQKGNFSTSWKSHFPAFLRGRNFRSEKHSCGIPKIRNFCLSLRLIPFATRSEDSTRARKIVWGTGEVCSPERAVGWLGFCAAAMPVDTATCGKFAIWRIEWPGMGRKEM